MPDSYVPAPNVPVGGEPILLAPSTFARHERAVEMVEGDNTARYPRAPRGRTTHPAPGAWGYLASGHTISAASGLSLGTGTVQLCSRVGGALTADGDNVDVLNSGGAIAGPKALELDWVAGSWAVCDCTTVSCGPFCTACGGVHLQSGTITDVEGTHDLKASNAPSFGAGGLWTDAISYSVPDPPGCVVCTDPRTGASGPGIYWWNIGCFGGAIFASVYWGVLNAADPRFYNPQCFATFAINGNPLIGECTTVSNGNSVAPTCGEPITGSGTNTWSTPGLFFNSPPASGAFSFSLSALEPAAILCCVPCPIPKTDLTMTAVRLSDGNTTTSTLAWDSGSANWHTSDSPPYDGLLRCVSGNVQLQVNGETEVLSIGDFTCEPVHMHFRNPGYPTSGFDYYVDE